MDNIIIECTKKGFYGLKNDDLQTLVNSVVLVKNYNGVEGSLVKIDFTEAKASAAAYSVQVRRTQLQEVIAEAQTEIDGLPADPLSIVPSHNEG